MKLTNRFNLPQTLVNAIERDPYTKGDARISVTGLLQPPRITHLRHKHYNDITSDVTDHIWSLFGRATHKILEDGGDEEHLTEERLFTEVRGWRVSGQVDLQKLPSTPPITHVKIADYKTCSAYALRDEKIEWVQQLNSYRWLLEVAKPDYKVSSLHVCAFVKDWNRHKAKDDMDYPVAPAVMVPIPMWDLKKAAEFVTERVRLHQEMLASTSMGDEPIECTNQERWMRSDQYIVIKPGNKRPLRVYENRTDAENYLAQRGPDYVVEVRRGEPIRCTGNYCQVSGWCKQYAAWQKAQAQEKANLQI